MPKWFLRFVGSVLFGWCLFSAGLPVAAAPAVSGNISGTVAYQYYEHKTGDTFLERFRQLANATVQVLDANNVLLGSGYTNALGAYSVAINTNGAPTTVTVQVLLTDAGIPSGARVQVVEVAPTWQDVVRNQKHTITVTGGAQQDFVLLAGRPDIAIGGIGQAAFLFDMLRNVAGDWAASNLGITPGALTVQYPNGCLGQNGWLPCYNGVRAYIHEDYDAYVEVVLHEYTHFIYGKQRNPSGTETGDVVQACAPFYSHNFGQTLAASCAYSEGFADFLSSVVRDQTQTTYTWLDAVGQGYSGYAKGVSKFYDMDFETQVKTPLGSAGGEYIEEMVAAHLWDLYDDTDSNDGDHVSQSIGSIWDAAIQPRIIWGRASDFDIAWWQYQWYSRNRDTLPQDTWLQDRHGFWFNYRRALLPLVIK